MWYLISFLLSFCSFSYEFILLKKLDLFIDGNLFIKNIMLGFFIFSIGLGALLKNKFKNINFALLEIIIALLSISLYYIIDLTYILESKYIYISSILFFCIVIGTLTGFEFPLLLDKINKTNIKRTNVVFFLYYVGSLISSISMAIIFYYGVHPNSVIIVISLINFLVALLIDIKKTYLISGYLLLLLLIFHNNVNLQSKINEFRYQNSDKVNSFLTPYQFIEKVYYDNYFNVFINGNFQFSSQKDIYHHFMVEPIKHMKKDVSILILGGGDGLLINELIKNKFINIKHIELDEVFYNFCKNDVDIKKLNNLALEKIETSFGDAYQYVKTTKDKYDVIFLDFPHPTNIDLSKLYSREFYLNIIERLQNDGIFVLDLPLKDRNKTKFSIHKKNKYLNNVLFNTLDIKSLQTKIFYNVKEEGFFVGSKKQIELKTSSPFLKINKFNESVYFESNNKYINSIFENKFKFEINYISY